MGPLRIFKSIHVKIVTIYVLLILIAMQVIGVYFTQQLEDQLVENFYETLDERANLLAYNVQQEINRDEEEAEQPLQTRTDGVLGELFNMENAHARVVDQYSNVITVTNPQEDIYIGQRTTNFRIIRALGGSTEEAVLRNANTGHRTRVLAVPVETEENQVVGAIYIEASMEEIYEQMAQTNQILLTGTMISLVLTAALGIFLSRTITRPIVEMRRQADFLGKGDFSQNVVVYGDDEIGELSATFNELTNKLEDAHASTEGERRKLSSVLTHMTDGVIATDREGQIILMNRRAEELVGYSQEETIGYDLVGMLNLAHFMTLADLYQMNDPILLDFDHHEEELILEANFSVIEKENGKKNGLIAVLHDVTEQERIEQERREFVANVSHELRTPLTSMKSYLEALLDGAVDDPDVAPQFLQVTSNETDRMIRLVNDLLQLSKMDARDDHIMMAEVNLINMIHHVIDRFEMSNKQENIHFKRKLPDATIAISGDRDKLVQLMDNMISNAVKYSPEGGVITIALKREKERVIISVKDEGVGIPKDNLPYVFDRFYRVDKARSRSLGGTGLGLAIAREIVEIHGGSIWVSSDWGKGTTFSFSLPLNSEAVNGYA